MGFKFQVSSFGLSGVLGAGLLFCFTTLADDFASLCADRAAIERVYHEHRTGTKPPFDQAMPRVVLERLVREDLRKEAVLRKVYAVEVTPALLAAEVQRINTTTRAPEMLAEIKHALDDDPERFARGMARPILVERELRSRFDNDDLLHAPQRGQVERTRHELLTAKTNGADSGQLLSLLKRNHSNAVTEITWQLGARPSESNAPGADLLEAQKHFGPNAQLLSVPSTDGKERKPYFEDLPGELQNVLRVQLRRPGDVSAVIEAPSVFLLYVAMEKTEMVLQAAGLSLPKRDYEQWLAERAQETK
jgi:hypothetical protein